MKAKEKPHYIGHRERLREKFRRVVPGTQTITPIRCSLLRKWQYWRPIGSQGIETRLHFKETRFPPSGLPTDIERFRRHMRTSLSAWWSMICGTNDGTTAKEVPIQVGKEILEIGVVSPDPPDRLSPACWQLYNPIRKAGRSSLC